MKLKLKVGTLVNDITFSRCVMERRRGGGRRNLGVYIGVV
jgi:hypothetical protein